MWKFHFYRLWNIRKTEKWLEDMERDGWMLTKNAFYFFFKFQKKKGREVKYFATHYHFWGRILRFSMYDTEYFLKSNYHAQKVGKGAFVDVSFLRICDSTANFSEFVKSRREYLKKHYLYEIIEWQAICSLAFMLILILKLYRNYIYGIIYAVFLIIFLLYVIDSIIGIVVLNKEMRKYDDK